MDGKTCLASYQCLLRQVKGSGYEPGFFLYFTRLVIMPDRSETSGTNLLRQVFDKMERPILRHFRNSGIVA